MPRPALDIANHFVEYSGYTKTSLQVQKMTFISHGYMLGMHDVPLVTDDVEAWVHGPVYPKIYQEFKKWGSGIIGKMSYYPKPFDKIEYEILDKIFAWYGRFCGYFLSDITHGNSKESTPWKQCYTKGRKVTIPNSITKEYYSKLYQERGFQY